MTGSWVQICTAASHISRASGKPVSVEDVHRLGDDDGPLTVEWLHDHYGVLASSLAAYLTDLSASECAGQQADVVAEHMAKPTFRGGPDLDVTTEDEYRREQGT